MHKGSVDSYLGSYNYTRRWQFVLLIGNTRPKTLTQERYRSVLTVVHYIELVM
jgi:hypothetical protein